MSRYPDAPPKTPELVCPAGNLEKGLAALRFGADAVYCGMKRFSLRQKAGNCDRADLAALVESAHAAGKRVYVAANIFPRDADLAALAADLAEAAGLGVDAFIVSDPAALRLARRVAPSVPLHLSTQANTLNSESAAFWFDAGITRIILARELSLAEIRAIAAVHPGRTFEVFAHGALCMAYSGRCFMSHYLAGRDSNRGHCAHPCRWSYRVEEALRPGEYFTVEEGPEGGLVFFSRDLCTLPLLAELVAAGAGALKIEGRIKSLYYVAVVTSVYRRALASLAEGEAAFDAARPALQAELDRLPHRGYTTHFLAGGPGHDPGGQPPDAREEREDYVGLFRPDGEGGLWLDGKNKFGIDEEVEVFAPEGPRPVRILAAFDRDGAPVRAVNSGALARLTVDGPVEAGDILRRRRQDASAQGHKETAKAESAV